jgi:hypothetical protein
VFPNNFPILPTNREYRQSVEKFIIVEIWKEINLKSMACPMSSHFSSGGICQFDVVSVPGVNSKRKQT